MAHGTRLPVILIPDPIDRGFTARCLAIPGCISDGDTREEALSNIREAIALCLESQPEEGWTLPAGLEATELEFVEVTTAA